MEDLCERGEGAHAAALGRPQVLQDELAGQPAATGLDRGLDLALEAFMGSLELFAALEDQVDGLEALDLAGLRVGPGGARQEAEPLVEATRQARAIADLEGGRGLEGERPPPRARVETLGDPDQRLTEGPVQGSALVAGGGVSGASLPEHREALLLVAEGVGVLEAQARSLGVLADVLEHTCGLLELAGVLESERRPQL